MGKLIFAGGGEETFGGDGGEGNLLGGIFPGGGMSKFLASGGLPQQGKRCRLLCSSAVGTCNIGEFIFDTHLKTGKQMYNSDQETKQLSC